jgi:hypothetical protein
MMTPPQNIHQGHLANACHKVNPRLKVVVGVVLLCLATIGKAQITWVAGNHALELSGTVSAFYNYRILKPGEVKHDNDRFDVRDAQFQLEGKKGRKLEYELQMDLADLAANMAGRYDPENPGLMDAWVKYKGFKPFDIQIGYGKLPYSRSSLLPIKYSAFWQRPEFARGDFYARRDVGVTLHRDLLQNRINLMGGVYTGLGEVSLGGRNDASGIPEGVFRVEWDFPARVKDRELDTRHTPVPLFSMGANARYTHKQLPMGESFPAHATGAYGIKTLDGQRTAYGVDAMVMWEGFSLMSEFQQIIGRPTSPTSALYFGVTDSLAGGHFKSGGYYVQAAYCFKKPRLIVAARWEDYNINDLAPGFGQRIAGAINYQLDGFGNTLKLHYIHVLKEETIADPLDWTDQIRLGWQVAF